MRYAILTCLVLSGCGTVTAPIVDATHSGSKANTVTAQAKPATSLPSAGATYAVVKGDTLFSIAFANGLDYHDLASWNNLESPDVIKIGQILRLAPPGSAASVQPVLAQTVPAQTQTSAQTMAVQDNAVQGSPLPAIVTYTTPQAVRLPWSEANWAKVNGTPVQAAEVAKPVQQTGSETSSPVQLAPEASDRPSSLISADGWVWPASGKLLGNYGSAGGKGIDVAGTRGEPILAAADGKVVYSGSGLRGYGQLVIIKHANEYLSAYAHNQKILVHEGETVKAGQKIAEMGDSDSDRVKLHFEIRQYGKPIDPLTLLPKHS